MKKQKVSHRMFNVLKHPLLAVFIGGVISAFLAPYITDQWQNHQKELEVKTDLISRISQDTAAIIGVTELMRAININQSEQTDAYLHWEISSAAIGSQLSAYFPGTHLDQDWDNYSAIMLDYFSLPTNDTACDRLKHIRNIQMYMFDSAVHIAESSTCPYEKNVQNIQRSHYYVNSANINWINLITRGNSLDRISWNETVGAANSTKEEQQYEEAFNTLKQEMLNQKDVLVRLIIQSHIPAI